MKRVIFAGTSSGCGKTNVTCAVLQALRKRGFEISSFKCGCDYIDPMFHKNIIGTEAHNLDSFFCTPDTLKHILYEYSVNSDISVIEGVMGFYDGVDGRGSAYSVAEITDTSVVLVVDCKGMSDSIGAVISGFLGYKSSNNIVGVIFNRLSERLVPLAKKICSELGTEYLGRMPTHKHSFESRHLGLVIADEITDIKEKMERLGELAENCIRLDRIIQLAERVFPDFMPLSVDRIFAENPPIIAVARDKAFCFLYSENIEILEKIGCKIEYFSPLDDMKIPENANGLILCGGYPELYAERLAENLSMRESVRNAVLKGIPTIAECGGFMYLNKQIKVNDFNYDMAGVFDSTAYKTDRLQRFGYITLISEVDSLLFGVGDRITAHEFHYWDCTDCGAGLTAEKHDGKSWKCGFCSEHMYAGFPHIYFYSDIRMARRFALACAEYGGKNGKNIGDFADRQGIL
ncbi:MAG: cobyrinate a,c-diamide synthase [Ruminococcus sp.]|nr:cobyrinate a,c-diamide synthase [Ruminococcus sp.]